MRSSLVCASHKLSLIIDKTRCHGAARAALALGRHLWEARLPEELRQGATPGASPRPATRRWLELFRTNLLENPCFLMSHQEMRNPHVSAPVVRK